MDQEKYVDESWKESTEEEKNKLKQNQQNTDSSGPAPQKEEMKIPEAVEAQEKNPEELKKEALQEPDEIQINFMNYVTSLGYQALIFLGEIPNPITNETEKNADQAKFLIDTLLMLREKTKGNLNQQEEKLLGATIYELQMKFIEMQKKEEK